jgi:hypothetical protein
VFSKPIYNMRGMGTGSRAVRGASAYRRAIRPGHMWMTLLEGDHVSTDLAVVDGSVRWLRHAIGLPLERGMFDRWIVEDGIRPDVEATAREWIGRNLAGYTGMVNAETIGGRIIEVHLRFSDQWPVRLYAEGRWTFRDETRRPGHSVVLFGEHGARYRHPAADLLAELRGLPGVSSIQITFHEDRDPALHAMPPGGFRLAIVNTPDLELGRAVRERLARLFGVVQELAPGRRAQVRRAAG